MKIATCFMVLGLVTATAGFAAEPPQTTDAGTAGAPTASASMLQITSGGQSAAPGGSDYRVQLRKPKLTFFPCSQCHENMTPNPEPRELYAPHPKTLDHGGGRFWCLSCHTLDDRDSLHRMDGTPLDFDDAPELCATCHMARYRDWEGGAHGKRIDTWQGERVIAACPECHNPHSPTIKPRAPKPPPPVRRDLARPQVSEPGAEPVQDPKLQEVGYD